MDTFGERLRFARERRQISQSALARSIGVKPQSISEMETEPRAAASKHAVALAHALGVSAAWLAEGTGEIDMRDRTDPTPVRQLFAAALTHARTSSGFNDVTALAKACGVPEVRLNDFEAARDEPTLDELYALVNATGLSLDRLFGLVRTPGGEDRPLSLNEPAEGGRRIYKE